MSYKILIIDDEQDIRDIITLHLEIKGYQVISAVDGLNAIEVIQNNLDVDLVILDIMMPNMSGLEACVKIRDFTDVPILFLTARSSEKDKIEAYNNGGDDYLVKPFSQGELLAKVDALIRRYRVYKGKPNHQVEERELDDLLLNFAKRKVYKNGEELDLTDAEMDILFYLDDHRGVTCDAQSIYEAVWEEPYFTSANNTVMVHIFKLRKKLGDEAKDAQMIKTVWGKGYRIDER